jgi:hypothetical protein
MANQHVYQSHCEYISYTERPFDFKDNRCQEAFSDILVERIDAILKKYHGWDINSHSFTFVGETLLFTVILQQTTADYLATI